MSKKPRQPAHYVVISYTGGAAITCTPHRKPSKRRIKEDRVSIDDDLVISEYAEKVDEFHDLGVEARGRLSDLLANRINMRRAVRELVLPILTNIENSLSSIHERLERVEQALTYRTPADTEGGMEERE